MKAKNILMSIIPGLLTMAIIALVIAWFAGVFTHQIPPGTIRPDLELAGNRPIHRVTTVQVPIMESATGTIRARREALVSSRIMARVEQVMVKAGQSVTKGQTLVVLDDSDLQSRLAQAKQTLEEAKAGARQAQSEKERSQGLFAKKLLSPNAWDRVRNNAEAAAAALGRAEERLAETKTNLSHATVTSPLAGMVVEKKINPGDMAVPGGPLVAIYDPTHMQLWAEVRESLALELKTGAKVEVLVPALHKQCKGLIDEIVPAADPGSRTFLVKVSGPCPPGIFPGTYGKLLLPRGNREEIHIPTTAVGRMGQLELVKVVTANAQVVRRFIRLGSNANGKTVTVLAGLRPGDQILAQFTSPGR